MNKNNTFEQCSNTVRTYYFFSTFSDLQFCKRMRRISITIKHRDKAFPEETFQEDLHSNIKCLDFQHFLFKKLIPNGKCNVFTPFYIMQNGVELKDQKQILKQEKLFRI